MGTKKLSRQRDQEKKVQTEETLLRPAGKHPTES